MGKINSISIYVEELTYEHSSTTYKMYVDYKQKRDAIQNTEVRKELKESFQQNLIDYICRHVLGWKPEREVPSIHDIYIIDLKNLMDTLQSAWRELHKVNSFFDKN